MCMHMSAPFVGSWAPVCVSICFKLNRPETLSALTMRDPASLGQCINAAPRIQPYVLLILRRGTNNRYMYSHASLNDWEMYYMTSLCEHIEDSIAYYISSLLLTYDTIIVYVIHYWPKHYAMPDCIYLQYKHKKDCKQTCSKLESFVCSVTGITILRVFHM